MPLVFLSPLRPQDVTKAGMSKFLTWGGQAVASFFNECELLEMAAFFDLNPLCTGIASSIVAVAASLLLHLP